MEPVSAALLLALAASVGSSAGQQAWTALNALLRRPFRRAPGPEDTDPSAGPATGEAQWAALAATPDDGDHARRLSAALAARAREDPAFARAVDDWHRDARRAVTGSGDVHNTVTGGSGHTVVQARDVHGGIHFGTPAAPPDRPERSS